jgi:hypothetical protein
MLLKAEDRDLPTRVGWPRYFSYLCVVGNPKSWVVSCLRDGLVFLLKKMEIFSLLSLCPDAFSYFSNSRINLRHFTWFALQNKRLSSAKNKCMSREPFFNVETPMILPTHSAWWRREHKASVHMRKRYGDKGFPCLISRVGTIFSTGCSFTTTE